MHPDNRIAVLMSTWNGEAFLREQIDSVLSQKDAAVTLFIRDDGSTDGTKEILSSYAERENVRLLQSDKNLGAAMSFMTILYETEGFSAYAFADQDDLWEEDKLSEALAVLNRHEEKPFLYCSNQTVFEDGQVKGLRYDKEPRHTLMSTLYANHIAGCTMVMNRALRDLLARPDRRIDPSLVRLRMHDTWTMLAALAAGDVFYDSTSHIRYRIHSENAVGVRYDEMTLRERTGKIAGSLRSRKDVRYRQKTAAELLRLFPDMKAEEKRKVQEFAVYRRSAKDRMRLLRDEPLRRECGASSSVWKMKAFFGTL